MLHHLQCVKMMGTSLEQLRNDIKGKVISGIKRVRSLYHCKPDFLIVGAQKAGTSSLYYYLSQHPQILPAKKKEVHFFDHRFDRGLHFYLNSFFPRKRERANLSKKLDLPVITGEASPYYLYHPLCANRIKATLPRVKIIILLRNPITRAFSHYQQEISRGRETVSFAEAIQNEKKQIEIESKKVRNGNYNSEFHQHKSFVDRGIYYPQVKKYYDLFGKDRVLVINSEKFFSELDLIYGKVLNFLDIEPFMVKDKKTVLKGTYGNLKIDKLDELKSFYLPHNKKLYELIGQEYDW